MLSAYDLRVFYPTKQGSFHALGPISFTITKGEFVSILGPSGCGKSTLAKVCASIVKNFDGELRIDSSTKRVANVFQDYGVFPWKTAIENVSFAVRESGKNKSEANEIAQHWLNLFRIGNFSDSYPHQLSGGMKQRLSLARALAVSPELLILDEPFAAIDTQLREELQEELLSLHQTNSMTTLQFTHNYDEAILLSDRILIMSSSPATFIREISIPFGWPRTAETRESDEFVKVRSELREIIRGEA